MKACRRPAAARRAASGQRWSKQRRRPDPDGRTGARADPRRAHRIERATAQGRQRGRQPQAAGLARDARIAFSVGYDLTETIRVAIRKIPDEDWVTAIDQDGGNRPIGHVTEITDLLDLTAGSRLLARRERADPGAQLTFTDIDGHRFQAILTDQASDDIAQVERGHRARARVEDHMRNERGHRHAQPAVPLLRTQPVWLEVVRLAYDLIVWTQRLGLTGQLARCEPKRLRYRLLHVAARLAFHARTATLRLQAS